MTSSPAYHEYFEYRRYPLRLPALAGGADPVRHPVAIAGGGPIGLALALGLARHGVRSVVIEAYDAVSARSRRRVHWTTTINWSVMPGPAHQTPDG